MQTTREFESLDGAVSDGVTLNIVAFWSGPPMKSVLTDDLC